VTTPEMISMGCRLNISESEAMRQILMAGDIATENLIIVHSCAVSNEAVRYTRQAIPPRQERQSRQRDCRHRLRRPGRSSDVCRDAGNQRSGWQF